MWAARGEKGSQSPMATTDRVESISGRDAVSWMKGIFWVLIMWIMSV